MKRIICSEWFRCKEHASARGGVSANTPHKEAQHVTQQMGHYGQITSERVRATRTL